MNALLDNFQLLIHVHKDVRNYRTQTYDRPIPSQIGHHIPVVKTLSEKSVYLFYPYFCKWHTIKGAPLSKYILCIGLFQQIKFNCHVRRAYEGASTLETKTLYSKAIQLVKKKKKKVSNMMYGNIFLGIITHIVSFNVLLYMTLYNKLCRKLRL